MHEFSLAEAVLNLAREHVPSDTVLEAVHVEAGPMRGIEPDAMQWAWQALVDAEGLPPVRLDLTITPWHLECLRCHHTFDAPDAMTPCRCGCERATPVDSNGLRLVSIEVEERNPRRASQSDRKRTEAQRRSRQPQPANPQ